MNSKNIERAVWQRPSFFIAFGFGTGLFPIAPGTAGTLAALPIYALIFNFSPLFYLITCLSLLLIGIPLCSFVAKEIGIDDYGGIVWDEIVGYLFTMFLVPPTLLNMVGGFVLFRLFDIVKPPPINWFEKKLQWGVGIMIDDVLASIPACLILHLLIGLHWL